MISLSPGLAASFPVTFEPECSLAPDKKELLKSIYRAFHHGYNNRKLYFDNFGLSAYAKPECPSDPSFCNSLRPTMNPSVFIVTLNRKDPSTIVGRGSYKVIKLAFQVTIVSTGILKVVQGVIAKSLIGSESPLRRELQDLLSERRKNLPNVELTERTFYRTSKRTFKAFHFAEQATCNALELFAEFKDVRFFEYMKVFHDILKGLKALYDLKILHNDLKPENFLVYRRKRDVVAKVSDLDALVCIDTNPRGQTPIYLSPFHRCILIRKMLEEGTLLTRENILGRYIACADSLLMTKESLLASFGIILTHIRILLDFFEIDFSEAQDILLSQLIMRLTGGFGPLPTPPRPKFLCCLYEYTSSALNQKLIDIDPEKPGFPLPQIDFEEAIAMLNVLSTPESEKCILATPITLPSLVSPIHPRLLDELRFILSIALQAKPPSKIYFDFLKKHAYIKKDTLPTHTGLSSVRILSSNVFMVELNRTSDAILGKGPSKIAKRVTEIRFAEGVLRARELALVKNHYPQPTLFSDPPMAKLSGLRHVECVSVHPCKQTRHLLKFAYLSDIAFSNLDESIKKGEVSFPQLIEYIKDMLLGMHELHTNGIIYGNLRPNNVLIFPDSEKGRIAKIGFSDTAVLRGMIMDRATYHFLSFRLQIEVKKIFQTITPLPEGKDVISSYNEDSRLRQLLITFEDEIVTTGLVILYILFRKKVTYSEQEIAPLCEVLKDLTGGFFPSSLTISMSGFFTEVTTHVSELESRAELIPPPRITLLQAVEMLNLRYPKAATLEKA